MTINLAVVCGIREFQKYFFSDGETLPLLSRKVFLDELAVRTSKVVEGVSEVLAYIKFWTPSRIVCNRPEQKHLGA